MTIFFGTPRPRFESCFALGRYFFFGKKICAKKKSAKWDSNLKPAAPLVQALPLHNFGVWSWKRIDLVFILLIYGCQHAIGPVLWVADIVGIYPFNLELKFVNIGCQNEQCETNLYEFRTPHNH